MRLIPPYQSVISAADKGKYGAVVARQSAFLSRLAIGITSEFASNLILDRPHPMLRASLHQVLMEIKSSIYPDFPVFHSIDRTRRSDSSVTFTFLPENKSDARMYIAGLVPYLRDTRDACYLKPFTEEARAHHQSSVWDPIEKQVSSTSDVWICNAPNMEIKAGGYFAFDEVFQGTDHRTLWVDILYNMAFEHNMAPLVRPQARRLQCKDPRLVDNCIRKYEEIIIKNNLISRALALEERSKYNFDEDLQKEFEEMDLIRYNAIAEAERKCRKLRMGNVDYSPTIQLAMRQIRAWSLLIRKKKGLKVSLRLLARTRKKAAIDVQNRAMGLSYLEEQLKLAHRYYYLVKSNSGPLRSTALESRAAAVAEKDGITKAAAIKSLKGREEQRRTARKIKHVRGKLVSGSTTLVTVSAPSGELKDIVEKAEIEQAIMQENKHKYQQSFHTPFLRPLGVGYNTEAILNGSYVPPSSISPLTKLYLQHLAYPNKTCNTSHNMPLIKVEDYQRFWKKARENTSSYPGTINFSTLKAGAHSNLISTFDCTMTRIPLSTGYSPIWWRKCIDLMILKKAGITTLSSLHTIVLFAADCNYAFKHIGRQMMKQAEAQQSLAPEQFGSCKGHKAIDQALNKVLTNDLPRQLKIPGAICSNDAKSYYNLIVHAPASLSMQRQGVPKNTLVCLFNTLQNLSHQIRTAYGDSVDSYGGSQWIIPMHSVGQGNGAGPAIWTVVSTQLLAML